MSWIGIIDDPIHKETLLDSLSKVANELSTHIEKTTLGLRHGLEGIILFYAYYYKLTRDERYLEKTIDCFHNIFDSPDYYDFYEFKHGFTGLGWLFEHVCKMNLFGAEPESVLRNINIEAEFALEEMKSKGCYDLMNGAIGIGLYFFSKKNSSSYNHLLSRLIVHLNRKAIREAGGGIKWPHYNGIRLEKGLFNLSMSRGIPGIIAFLLKTYREGLPQPMLKELIEGGIRFLLNHQQNEKVVGSYFPYEISGKRLPQHSRLAWCYGDLSIGYTIFLAGVTLHNTNWTERGLEIMTFNASRRNSHTEYVMDADLCHGTSGIAQVFMRIYNHTQNDLFRRASLHWICETQKMARFPDGICGYKSFNHQLTNYRQSSGLFEGVSGTGLALIAAIAEFPPEWDECLLLS